ncbi:MAG: hypothetical protein A2177_05935 [Spirochaetes bacterium RBG_13_68_11]|nr:MAG: hypothetical protein A2177_05935 [Spirochaetes bacterium RBG_13_68_11]
MIHPRVPDYRSLSESLALHAVRARVKALLARTAEDVALKNLKRGVPARTAADRDNPFVQ